MKQLRRRYYVNGASGNEAGYSLRYVTVTINRNNEVLIELADPNVEVRNEKLEMRNEEIAASTL